MIPSIMCYVHTVEVLGPTTPPVFKPGSTTPQISNMDPRTPRFQTGLTCLKRANDRKSDNSENSVKRATTKERHIK